MLKKIFFIILLAVIGTFYVRNSYPAVGDAISLHVENFFGNAPCQKPLTYSLGSFDIKFYITKSDFLSAVNEAAQVWNKVVGKSLFQYSSDGGLKINLIYDYRQEATDKLKTLGFTIDNTRSSYDSLKSEYLQQKSTYDATNAALESQINNFQSKKQKYSADIAYWNSRGGAPKDTYDSLNAEGAQLKSEADQINIASDNLNKQVATINALVDALNLAAREINVNVQTFNKIGQSTGEEFSEGLYISDITGNSISVYQFSNRAQLVRLLTHEFGHALGLEHVSDPNAIMYKLNESKNLTPTKDDVTELKTACHIK